MEQYPDAWIQQPLEGSMAYRNVDYIIVTNDPLYHTDYFQCLLCETGMLKSERTCQDHVQGRRHTKNYQCLWKQQQIWIQEFMEVPEDFTMPNSESDLHSLQKILVHQEDDSISGLRYVLAFRRWHYNRWKSGWCCQLCGTRELPTRKAVVDHCTISRRHATYRNATMERYHSIEYHWLQPKLEQLPSVYAWHVECAFRRYLAAKESSFAGLASRRYEWYLVCKTLQSYQLRYQMSLLECAIWKQHMLQINDDTRFQSLHEVQDFICASKLRVGSWESYRQSRRVTSGVTVIVHGVLPFLKQSNPMMT